MIEMICLKHCQQYSEGQFCVYCGSPFVVSMSSASTETEAQRTARKRKEKAIEAGKASPEKRWANHKSSINAFKN